MVASHRTAWIVAALILVATTVKAEEPKGFAGEIGKGGQDEIEPIAAVGLSADGARAFVAGDRSLSPRDTATGQGLDLSGHDGGVFDAAFSADGETLVSLGEEDALPK